MILLFFLWHRVTNFFTAAVIIKIKSPSQDQTVCAVQQREKMVPEAIIIIISSSIIIISGKQKRQMLCLMFLQLLEGAETKIRLFLYRLSKHFISIHAQLSMKLLLKCPKAK